MEAQIRNQIISKCRCNELRRQLLKKRLKPHTSNRTGDCPELRGSKKTNAEYESLQFVSEPLLMIDGPDGIVEIRLYQGLNVSRAEGVDILPKTPV